MTRKSTLFLLLTAAFCSCNKTQTSSEPAAADHSGGLYPVSQAASSPGALHNSIIAWYDAEYQHNDTIFNRTDAATMAQRIENFMGASFAGDYSDTLMFLWDNAGAFDSDGNLGSMYDVAASILTEEANEDIQNAVKNIMTYKEPTGFINFAKQQFANLPLNPTEIQKVAVYLDILEHSYDYNKGGEQEMEIQSNAVDITVQIYRARYITSMDAVGSMIGFERALRNGASIQDAAIIAGQVSALYSAVASRKWDDQFGGNW